MVRTIHNVTLVLILALIPGAAWAAKSGRIDLSTGLVFPSDNGTDLNSRFINPAALASSMKTLDVFGSSENGIKHANASVVGSGKSAGFGVGFDYVDFSLGTMSSIIAGLATGGSKWSIGAGGAYNLDTTTETIDAGLRLGGKDGMSIGVTASDLTGAEIIAGAGVGYRKAGSFRIEGNTTYGMETKDLDISAGVGLEVGDKFTIVGGYRADGNDLGGGDVSAGASFWISKAFNLNYRYKYGFDHTVGFKVAF